jgi:hypothetical protein
MPNISPVVMTGANVSLDPNVGIGGESRSYAMFEPRSSWRDVWSGLDNLSVGEVASCS